MKVLHLTDEQYEELIGRLEAGAEDVVAANYGYDADIAVVGKAVQQALEEFLNTLRGATE